MTTEDKYTAAIEISSSKIIGAVGIMRKEGKMDVLAVEQERCINYVSMGFIQNVEETAHRINRLIEKLEKKVSSPGAQLRITKVFVGLSGRSMRSISVDTHVSLPEDSIVSKEIVAQLHEQACHQPLDGTLEMMDCVPRIYLVDKRETPQPEGWVGSSVEATFDLLVSRPELKKNILRTFSKLPNLEVAQFIITPLATGQLVVSEDQKELGCMLVDMGAETTTVIIYRSGALNYYATLPMGSRNITRDIMTLKVSEERAEDLKLTAGNALPPTQRSTLDYHGVKQSDVSDLVVARAEEITANIMAQVQYAGLTNEDLPRGIILIGGGSKLNGMEELLRNLSDLKVQKGEFPSYINMVDSKVPTVETLEVVGVLYAAASYSDVNCLEKVQHAALPDDGEPNEEPEEKKPAKPKKPTKQEGSPSSFGIRLSALKDRISKIFTAEEDDDEELY